MTFEDWRGGVIPAPANRRLNESRAITTAAVLAGALGVSEVFQFLRGNPMAGSRSVGLSLWAPGHEDWEHAPAGPMSIVLPSRLWLIGLGHLGQAYLWVLGLLPYENPGEVELVLQDFDRLTLSNDSTSLLTTPALVGERKTRAMARWAEARGFRTRLVERLFPGGITVTDDEPRLALGGVDTAQARAAYEDAGFDCVIEAGLGAGPTEYLAMRALVSRVDHGAGEMGRPDPGFRKPLASHGRVRWSRGRRNGCVRVSASRDAHRGRAVRRSDGRHARDRGSTAVTKWRGDA